MHHSKFTGRNYYYLSAYIQVIPTDYCVMYHFNSNILYTLNYFKKGTILGLGIQKSTFITVHVLYSMSCIS
jgi:hypothetical protein